MACGSSLAGNLIPFNLIQNSASESFMSKHITDIVPIVAGVFTNSGSLDEDSFQSLFRHLIETGASTLTLFGLATEFYELADHDRSRMQALLLEETSRSKSVAGILSITDHSWEVACHRPRTAEEQGTDGMMGLPPFFDGPSEDAIFEHLKRVVGSVNIPVIAQYAPVQTGARISPEVLLNLNDALPNAEFVKVETQPPGRYVSQLVERSLGKLKPLVGYTGVQLPDVLARGAVGIQPGCSFTEI